MTVSIIICCYNSAPRISRVIASLAAQTGLAAGQMEVVVVDNRCTDDTVAVALAAASELNVAINVVEEPRPGLTYARERGRLNSTGQYLVFCDDDNFLDPNYLATGLRSFLSDPTLAGLTGHARASTEAGAELPPWFDAVAGAYACHAKTPQRSQPNALAGAALMLRRAALDSLENAGFVPQLTDRKGQALSSGGDSELTFALSLLGWRLQLEPEAKFTHLIDPQRLTPEYLARLGKGIGSSIPYLLPYVWALKGKSLLLLRASLYRYMRSLFHAFLAIGWSIRSKLLGDTPASYHASCQKAIASGLLQVGADERWSAVIAQVERLRLDGQTRADSVGLEY